MRCTWRLLTGVRDDISPSMGQADGRSMVCAHRLLSLSLPPCIFVDAFFLRFLCTYLRLSSHDFVLDATILFSQSPPSVEKKERRRAKARKEDDDDTLRRKKNTLTSFSRPRHFLSAFSQ